jgi:hypothetical protein
VCVLALAATPAMAFTEFIQKPSESGNQGKGGLQVFKTKAGTVECTEEKSDGGGAKEKLSEAFEEAKYEKCKASGAVAKVSEAQYSYQAKGTASINNKILIKAEPSGVKCEVEIAPENKAGGKNKELGVITYTNNKPGITIKASQKEDISYDVIENGGGLCGTVGAASNGTYTGEAKTETYAGLLCIYTFIGRWLDPACTIGLGGVFSQFGAYANLEVQ